MATKTIMLCKAKGVKDAPELRCRVSNDLFVTVENEQGNQFQLAKSEFENMYELIEKEVEYKTKADELEEIEEVISLDEELITPAEEIYNNDKGVI